MLLEVGAHYPVQYLCHCAGTKPSGAAKLACVTFVTLMYSQPGRAAWCFRIVALLPWQDVSMLYLPGITGSAAANASARARKLALVDRLWNSGGLLGNACNFGCGCARVDPRRHSIDGVFYQMPANCCCKPAETAKLMFGHHHRKKGSFFRLCDLGRTLPATGFRLASRPCDQLDLGFRVSANAGRVCSTPASMLEI